jgi:antitoxin YobK
MNNEELNQRLAHFETVEPSGPVSESLIAAAEQQLGVQFPPQYRAFLSVFGSGGVDSEDFIGLGGPEHLDIAKLVLRLRDRNNPLPARLLPIRGDGFGNYDCFDTDQPTSQGEYAIVQWNHEAGAVQECERLYDSFDDWFESVLVMIKENG